MKTEHDNDGPDEAKMMAEDTPTSLMAEQSFLGPVIIGSALTELEHGSLAEHVCVCVCVCARARARVCQPP
jgi:hypothetical protein